MKAERQTARLLHPAVIVPLAVVLVLGLIALYLDLSRPDALERVQRSGELVMVTRNGPTTYYQGPDGPLGLEYDLGRLFAAELGVELKVVVASGLPDTFSKLHAGQAHFAAAGLTVTRQREETLRFSHPYQTVTQQVLYRTGSRGPKTVEDLIGHQLEVVADSSHAENLRMLRQRYPELEWTENAELGIDGLLALVAEQVVEYTVSDSNELAIYQRFYPELRVGFDVTEPQPLAWAFPRTDDDSLYEAAQQFFEALKESGELKRLVHAHYGHVGGFDYVGTRTYQQHIKQRLPEFERLFRDAGKQTGLDWQLLAAMGYQESHWDPTAKSPTGVRGIMMLTKATAKQLGVEDRTDPEQSIKGGAEYFLRTYRKIPERIPEPDRTFMALAAYNVGFGHLEDARIITERRGGNPDRWEDLKANLPLLSQKKWHKTTRHGYARGREPVRYVENVRSYYQILNWVQGQEKSPPVEEHDALRIETPAL